jgi:hypothetical protein
MHDDSHITPAPISTPVQPGAVPPAPPAGYDPRHPAQIVTPAPLAQQQPYAPHYAQPAKKSNWKWWIGGALLVLQLVAPYELRPTTWIGGIVADMTRQTSSALVENQILIAKSQKLAEAVAELKANYAHRTAQCNLAAVFGPEAQRICQIAVDQYFLPAIRQAEEALAVVENQLRRR